MSDKLVKLPPENSVRVIEAALKLNVSNETAAAMVGISLTTFYRWSRIREVGERFRMAAAEGRFNLETVATKGATQGFVTTEKRTTRKPDENGGMEVTEEIEIIRQLPPDLKTAVALLRARYPEEYGNINRVDTQKFGTQKDQIDRDGTPEKIENPKDVLDMILKGDGSYHLKDEDDGDEEKFIENKAEEDGW
jgi:hypothetical protein